MWVVHAAMALRMPVVGEQLATGLLKSIQIGDDRSFPLTSANSINSYSSTTVRLSWLSARSRTGSPFASAKGCGALDGA
jgi:hypothetical protein